MKLRFLPFLGSAFCVGMLAIAGCGKHHQPLAGIYEQEDGSMQTNKDIFILDSMHPDQAVFGILSNQMNLYALSTIEYSSNELTVHFPSKKVVVLKISENNSTLTCSHGCEKFGKVFHLSSQPSGQPIPDFVVTEYFNKYKQEAAH